MALQGIGLGLRSPHIAQLLRERPPLPWLEVLADNHMVPGGIIPPTLDAVREIYPLTLHCVGMSLGGTDPLDTRYLDRVRYMIDRYSPELVSDHLCFTQHNGRHYHDLLPLPYTEEALTHVSNRVEQVQEYLGRPLVVENVSSYVEYVDSVMTEAEFLRELVNRTGCSLLLDINNVYVSSVNHGFDAHEYLHAIPAAAVAEIHLAGHEQRDGFLLDAHNNHVAPEVLQLYRDWVARHGESPTLIEWDNDIPSLDVLLAEVRKVAA